MGLSSSRAVYGAEVSGKVEKLKALAAEAKFNKQECVDLTSKLSEAVGVLIDRPGWLERVFPTSFFFCPLFEDLDRVIIKVTALMEENSRPDWLAVAINMDNKEVFKELLLEVKICYISACIRASQQPSLSFDSANSESQPCHDLELFDDHIKKGFNDSNQEYEEQAMYLKKKLDSLRMNLTLFEYGRLSPLAITMHRELGRGGCGTVFAVKWMGKKVAMKEFLYEYDFHKEASILARLSHPNIIKFFHSGEWIKSGFFIVMELGRYDLLHVIEQSRLQSSWVSLTATPFSLQVAFDIIFQIARGMRYIHDKQVAHFDLKPHNIVVTEIDAFEHIDRFFNVKIIDFVSSEVFARGQGEKPTWKGRKNIGTTVYMAPEFMQVPGIDTSNMVVDPFKADVFSFAVVCYQILSGERPFEENWRVGHFPTRREILRFKLEEKPKKLWAFVERNYYYPETLSNLKYLIEKCWAANPEERPTFESICLTLEQIKARFLIHGPFRRNWDFHEVKRLMSKPGVVDEARSSRVR